MTAIPAARLLAAVVRDGEAIDTSDDEGRVVETYPAAALRIWGLPWKGYKGTDPGKEQKRAEMVATLAEEVGSWLTLVESQRRESDDMLDPLVAAL